MLHEMNIKSP